MRRAKVYGLVHRFALVLTVALLISALIPSGAVGSEIQDQDVDSIYRKTLYRIPTSDEIQEWKRKAENGASAASLVDELRSTEEHKEIRRHRRAEIRSLQRSAVAFSLLLFVVYILLVRKRPGRRLLFSVFVLMFGEVVFSFQYVYQKVHFKDFPSYYHAADFLYNKGISPYGAALSEQVYSRIFPFFHPPPFTFIFYPLSLMSFDTAKLAVILGNQIALCVLLYLLIIKNSRDSTALSVCLLVYVMIFHPVQLTMDYGQINFVTTIFICLFIHSYLTRKSDASIGLSLACASILKLYPACLLAYLCMKGRWKAVGWFLSAMVTCLGLALLTVPREVWGAWWHAFGSRAGYGGNTVEGLFAQAGPWNQGVHGMLMRIFTDSEFNVAIIQNADMGRLLTYLCSVLLVGTCGALIWLRQRRGVSEDSELEIGLVLVTMVAIVPLSWIHHGVMMLPAIIVAARRLYANPAHQAAPLFLASACILAWDWSCLPDPDLWIFHGGASVLLGSLRVFGLLGLFTTMVILVSDPLRSRKRPLAT